MSPRVKAGNGRDASGSQPMHTWATWLPKPEDSPPQRVTGAGAGSQRTQTLARDCPETVRGTQGEVSEHRQYPLRSLRRRTRTLL